MLIFSLVKKRGGRGANCDEIRGWDGGGQGDKCDNLVDDDEQKEEVNDNTRTPLLVPINLLLGIVSISSRVISLDILLVIHPPALFAWWMVVEDADNAVRYGVCAPAFLWRCLREKPMM